LIREELGAFNRWCVLIVSLFSPVHFVTSIFFNHDSANFLYRFLSASLFFGTIYAMVCVIFLTIFLPEELGSSRLFFSIVVILALAYWGWELFFF